jgi:CheY-like chemotaxis protein
MSDLFDQGGVLTQDVDVLVVDDDDEVRTSTAGTLRGLGCRVEEARDGDEAAVVMKLCRVRALALDARMAANDGMSALADLPQPPAVILLWAHPEWRGRRRVVSILVHAQNPILPRDLIDVVCRSVTGMETLR